MSHQKKTKLQRFQLLRESLLADPMSLQELIELYAFHGVNRSLRQIQRDLKELEHYVVGTEIIHTFFVRKIKYYLIEKSETEAKTSPTITDIVNTTQFYKPILTLEDEQKIALVQKAIASGNRIGISKIINDETGDNAHFETKQVELIPIELLLHRNNYYVGAYHMKRGCVVLFNIKQMVSVFLLDKKGNSEMYRDAYANERNNRFGVTKNIDNHVYEIKIEVAQVLITFIKNHHWHPSQKITKEKNHHYLHFTCGINRELIGWLCLWMYNIKIIHPPILQAYYQKSVRKMQANIDNQNPLVYRNIFVNESEIV